MCKKLWVFLFFILFSSKQVWFFFIFFTDDVYSTLVTSNKGENPSLIILFLVWGNCPRFSVSFAKCLNSGFLFFFSLKFVLYLCFDACPRFLLSCSRVSMSLLKAPFRAPLFGSEVGLATCFKILNCCCNVGAGEVHY